MFLCFRAPPNRLECLSTSTEIALREFRSFLWFRAPSKSAGVCPSTWLEIALREFFQFFVFSRTLQSARVSFHLARNRLARMTYEPINFAAILPRTPAVAGVSPHPARNRLARILQFLCFCPSSNRLECPCTWLENSAVFLCFRAPPNRLECLSTSTEIALREFRSFLWFRAPSKSAGVCPSTWLEIALREFFQFFVFSRTLQSARVSFHLARNRLARIPQCFLCFRLECLPTWTKIASHEFRSFFVFSCTLEIG